MSFHNPVRAFESYLEQAGKALISASPHQACALLSKAVTQFEIVMGDPHGITSGAVAGMQNQLRNLTELACEGERITSAWLEAIAPASELHVSAKVDIYG
jgi:hypothetical protein